MIVIRNYAISFRMDNAYDSKIASFCRDTPMEHWNIEIRPGFFIADTISVCNGIRTNIIVGLSLMVRSQQP
jgi:hypothetical protein